jgi:hypothetical protein
MHEDDIYVSINMDAIVMKFDYCEHLEGREGKQKKIAMYIKLRLKIEYSLSSHMLQNYYFLLIR